MDIQIRLVRPGDVPVLQQLILASARGLSQGYYTPEQIEGAILYIFGVDTQLISDQTYFVAEAGGQVVGCGGWSKRRSLFGGVQMKAQQDPLLDPAVDAGRIRAFFVHPSWARKGIGRRIIEACEAAARQAGFARLELVTTLPGEPLYAAMGYRVTRRFEQVMANGVSLPLMHMEKELAAGQSLPAGDAGAVAAVLS